MAVVKQDITRAAQELGVKKGDILLVHSSFKSLGEVDGGAETVIQGYLDAVGEDGTLVLPTFCQQEFEKAYDTWHIDKHSDTGYLTNYFRKREGSIRSDQATHSVAASGKLAYELTKSHGHEHKLWGMFGDTPFSEDSPWRKMYDMNARVIVMGVTVRAITFRHYAEYIFINECLDSIKGHPDYEKMKARLWQYWEPGAWPHIANDVIYEKTLNTGMWTKTTCGESTLISVEAKPFVDTCLAYLRNFEEGMYMFGEDKWMDWVKDLKEMQKELQNG